MRDFLKLEKKLLTIPAIKNSIVGQPEFDSIAQVSHIETTLNKNINPASDNKQSQPELTKPK